MVDNRKLECKWNDNYYGDRKLLSFVENVFLSTVLKIFEKSILFLLFVKTLRVYSLLIYLISYKSE